MNEVTLEGINFKIGKKELKLTMEEVKKLKNILDEIFEKQIIHVPDLNPCWYYNDDIFCNFSGTVNLENINGNNFLTCSME